MRYFIACALVALVSAAPIIEERGQKTVTDIVDVYTTVYEDEAAAATPTATVSSVKKYWYKGGKKSSSAAAAVTTVVVEPSSAPVAVAAYTAPVPTTYATTSTKPASTAAAPVASSAPNDYAGSVVDHHNKHRANHSSPALSWDAGLAATALKIANSCNYAHDTQTDGGGYGQNIAAGCPANNITSVITDLFYNSEEPNFNGLYGQATPSNINTDAFDGYGHFTQIVWKGTSAVGCATVDCTGKGKGPQGLGNVGSNVSPIFTVCNYKSAGNFLGEFNTNVLPSLGHPSISWSG